MTDKIKRLVELCRPYNTLSGVLLFTIGFYLERGHVLNSDYYLGALVIILGFTFATVQNDIEDRQIDVVNSPEKPLVSGDITIEEARTLMYVTALLLLCLSLYHVPLHVLPVLSLFFFIWVYNKPPFQLSHHPLGSILLLAFLYSAFPLVYSNILVGGKISEKLLVPIGLWILVRVSVAILKDFKDLAGDRAFNKRTFYLTFGYLKTVWISLICFTIGGVGILLLLGNLRDWGWLLIVPALLFLRNWFLRIKMLKIQNPKKLADLFSKIFLGQNQFDLAFLLCLLLLK